MNTSQQSTLQHQGMANWKDNDWEVLLTKIRSKQVIPIIGKDLIAVANPAPGNPAPAPVQFHDWISQKLLQRYEPELVNDSYYLESLVNKIVKSEKHLTPDDLKIEVAQLVERNFNSIDGANFEKLSRITDFKLFINTTFTPYLSHQLMARHQENAGGALPLHEISYLPNRPIQNLKTLPLAKKRSVSIDDLGKRCVLNLFGNYQKDPTSYLLSDNEVVDLMIFLLTDDDWKNSALFDLISSQNSHFLFLGCSFPDWLFKFFVRVFFPDWASFESNHKNKYLSDCLVNLDPSRAMFLSNNKVKVHHYPNVSDFVSELYRRWSNDSGAPPTNVRDQIVFISFANEDRELVRIISGLLAAYGIDYWLDEQDLTYGVNIRPELKTNIDKACVFIPVITRHSLLRDRGDFLLEWDYADRLLHDQQVNGVPVAQRLDILPILINPSAGNPVPQQAFGNVKDSFWNRRQLILNENELRATPDFSTTPGVDAYLKQVRDRQRASRSAHSIKRSTVPI